MYLYLSYITNTKIRLVGFYQDWLYYVIVADWLTGLTYVSDVIRAS